MTSGGFIPTCTLIVFSHVGVPVVQTVFHIQGDFFHVSPPTTSTVHRKVPTEKPLII